MKQNDSKTPNRYNGNPNTQSRQNRNHNGTYSKYDDSTAKQRQFPVSEDKAVWASYLNMARQNLCLTLCHICHVLGLKYNLNDRALEDKLINIPAVVLLKPIDGEKQNADKKGQKSRKAPKAEQVEKAMKLFNKHFPFLRPMSKELINIKNEDAKKKKNGMQGIAEESTGETPALYYEIMETMLPLINLLRNKYTHYKLIDPCLDESGKIIDKEMLDKCRKLARLIDYSTTEAMQIVKKRFSISKAAAQGSDNASASVNATILEPKDFKFLDDSKRYFETSNNEGENNRQQRLDFKYCTRHDETGISNIGIFMLICLMLNKKYASEFADKTDFFGSQQSKNPQRLKKEIAIMREIISVNRIRLPKERLESIQDASALGLDMLNELKKCPHELFNTLDAAHQERFRIKIEKDANENADDANDKDSDNGKVLMLRSRDRFADFALRYIDRMNLFKDIRFQVRLGYYRYKFYEKEWIDGFRGNADEDERVCILQKELTGFGRIDEIEPARNERWKEIIRKIDKPRKDSLDTKPYVTDHHASYLIHNNRIGLLWNSAEKQPLQEGIFMPNLTLPEWLTGYPQNAALIRGSDSKVASPIAPCVAPVCWLSIYELPAVIFLSLLTGSGKQAEKLIKSTVDNYCHFFNSLSIGNIDPQAIIPEDAKRQINENKAFRSNYVIEIHDKEIHDKKYSIRFADLPAKVQTYLLSEGLNDHNDNRFITWAKERLEKMIDATKARYEKFLNTRYSLFYEDLSKGMIIPYDPQTKRSFIYKDLLKNNRDSYIIKKYGIRFASLPTKIQDFLLSEETNNIDYHELLNVTDDKIDIRPGTLARYLAKDIMLFKEADADNRLKLTGQNFNILQAELALYKLSEAEWRTLLSKAELIDGPRPHPFLNQVLDSHPRTILDFYQTYLEKKIDYLSKIKDEDLKALHLMHPDRKKWAERDKAFYQELCGRYVSIELPKGLFLPAIVEALKVLVGDIQDSNACKLLLPAIVEALNEKSKKLQGDQAKQLRNALDNERKNVAYLIAAYFEALGDGSQDFYGNEFKRYYAYVSKLHSVQDSSQSNAKNGNQRAVKKHFLSVDELAEWAKKAKKLEETYLNKFNEKKEIEKSKLRNLRNEYTLNEKAIRRMKVQDMLLFRMAINLLTNVMDKNRTSTDLSEYRLKNIGSGTDGKDILSLELPFSIVLQVPVADGSMREITIRQDKLKLKNYGDFFRFIYDTRVRPLLAHARIENNILQRNHLDAELDKYDQQRIPLFKLVHELEGYIWEQLPEEKLHPKDVKVDFKYLLQIIDTNESDENLLRTIRNAFSHNEYPDKGISETTVKIVFEKSIPEIAETMVEAFDKESEKIKTKPTIDGNKSL